MKKGNNKYKAILAFAVALALILPVAAVANNQNEGEIQPTGRANTQVSIIPSAQIVEKGETFTVSVWCYPTEGINGIDFATLHFDETLINANSVTFDGFFGGFTTITSAGFGLLVIDNVVGEIQVVWEGIVGSGNVTTNGSFITVEFTAQNLLGTSPLDLETVQVTKEGPVVIPSDVNNGSVTIEEYVYLTMATSGSGTTTPAAGLHSYPWGTNVTLTATPDACWEFDNWSGAVTGSTNPTYIIMDDNYSATAHFSQLSYTLTTGVIGNGNIGLSPSGGTYLCGTTVTITANADPCWEFAGWSGAVSGMTNPETIYMDANYAVTATFTIPSYTLTTGVIGSGSITLNPPGGTYVCGTTVTMTAVPVSGWSFSGWSGDASGAVNPQDIVMDGHKTVTATFSEQWDCEMMINGTLPSPADLDIDMKDWVYFGEMATASDGVDSEDLPYPGTPPAPYVAGWFMTEFVDPYDELEIDMRFYPEVAPNDKIWDLWVETDTAGNGPTVQVYMTWNPADLINEYDYVELRDYLSGDTLVDMRAVGTFDFTADHGMGYHFLIVCGWNHCPVAVDDFYGAIEDVALVVAAPGVLANDYDDEGDPFTAVNPSTPAHGTLDYFNADGSFQYTPDPGFDGTDTFTYEVTDGALCFDEATVTITVCPSVHLDVNVGWNLISLPASELDFDKTEFLIDYLGTIYSWADALTNGYILEFTYGWTGGMAGVYVDEALLQPGEGYWLWAEEDCTLIMYSCAPEDNHIKTFDDGEGWYLVGAPYMYDLARWQTQIHYNALYYSWWDAAYVENAILYYLYDWDRPTQNYVVSENPDFLASGVGYWMYIYEPCSLKQL